MCAVELTCVRQMDSHSSLVDSHPWQIWQRSQLIFILVCRNKLKLTNHDKTEIVVIFSMYRTRPLFSDFSMGNATLTITANKAKSLGWQNAIWRARLNICRSSFYQLRNLSKTRRCVSVYLGVVVLLVWYFEHALLQQKNCHHILPEKTNPSLH